MRGYDYYCSDRPHHGGSRSSRARRSFLRLSLPEHKYCNCCSVSAHFCRSARWRPSFLKVDWQSQLRWPAPERRDGHVHFWSSHSLHNSSQPGRIYVAHLGRRSPDDSIVLSYFVAPVNYDSEPLQSITLLSRSFPQAVLSCRCSLQCTHRLRYALAVLLPSRCREFQLRKS